MPDYGSFYIEQGRVSASMRQNRVWHPNTQMSEWARMDEVVRGDGMYLVCADGTRLLDGVASMWCNVWGHSRRELVRAISRQAATLAHSPLFNLTHGPAQELADKLVGIAPGMHRVFYSDNGSSAVEIAAKMAVQYWANIGEPRSRLVSLQNGYHGDTFGAMSMGQNPEFFSKFKNHMLKIDHIPAPNAYRPVRGHTKQDDAEMCLEAAEKRLAKGDVAALVMESGAQMAGGVQIFPRGYQSTISKICKRHGTLLVLDEIATGFGRLGHMAEYVWQRSVPDIAVFGKMLTGGYATLGATLASKRVADAFLGDFAESRHLFHGHTYTGNPIAAAVALENIRLYARHSLIRRVRSTSKVLGGFAAEIGSRRLVGDVRHRGMVMGIELVVDPQTGAPPRSAQSMNRIVYGIAKKHGVYLRTLGNIIMLVPPLYMDPAHIRKLGAATLRIIDELEKRF